LHNTARLTTLLSTRLNVHPLPEGDGSRWCLAPGEEATILDYTVHGVVVRVF